MEKEHSSQFRRRMPRRPKIPKVDQCGNTGNIDMGRRVERAKQQSRGGNPEGGKGETTNREVETRRWEPKPLRRSACYAEAEPYGMVNLAAGVHSVNRG